MRQDWMDRNPSWRDNAACKGMDPEIFFEDSLHSTYYRRSVNEMNRHPEAKATCAACPVQAECASYADDVREVYGIWGGATPRDRRREIRRDRRERAAS